MIAKMFWLFMTHRNKVSKLLFSSIEAPKQIISLIHLKHLMKILTKTSKRDSWFCKYDVLPLLQWILREAKWRVVPCPDTWSHKDRHRHPIKYKHYHLHHQRYHQIQMTFPPPDIGTFNSPSAHYTPFDWHSCTSLTFIHLTSFFINLFVQGVFYCSALQNY